MRAVLWLVTPPGNLEDGLQGSCKLKCGYTGARACPGVWTPNQGYTQVFVFAIGATHGCVGASRRWDPQRGLHLVLGTSRRLHPRVCAAHRTGSEADEEEEVDDGNVDCTPVLAVA